MIRAAWTALRRMLGFATGASRRTMDGRFVREAEFHLEMAAERHRRAGHGAGEASRLARAGFGSVAGVHDDARDAYRSRLVDDFTRDARHAVRLLGRAPGFSAAAILTLALGVGATSVIYSIVDHVLLRPLPYADADRLLVARVSLPELRETYPSLPVNARHFVAWVRGCTTCESLAALRPVVLPLRTDAGAEAVRGVRTSSMLFSMLGATARRGRLSGAADDAAGADRVVVLSEGFWRRRFGGRPSAIGASLTLGDEPFTVIGVLPAWVQLPKGRELGALTEMPAAVDVFLPLRLQPWEVASPGAFDFIALVKRRTGVTTAQVRAQLDAISASSEVRGPGGGVATTMLTPLQEQVVGGARRPLLILLGAVGAVFLIVCVNLSALLLSRALARHRESSLRVALGAGTGRLVRQSLTECLLLSALGATAGVVAARAGLAMILRAAPADLPRVEDVRLDLPVLLVAALLAAVAVAAAGTLPALRFGRADPGDALRAGGRSATDARQARRGRSLLLGVQAATTAVLLFVVGLLARSFGEVLRADRGFGGERVLALSPMLSGSAFRSSDRVTRYLDAAVERLAALPGATAVSATNALPLEGEAEVNSVLLPGEVRPPSTRPLVNVRGVGPDYFRTLDIPVLAGRPFDAGDRQRPVVLVSERAARAFWPGASPIGQRISAWDDAPLAEVIGVTADVRTSSLEEEGSPTVYAPYWAHPSTRASLVIRTSGEPAAVAALAREALREVDPTVAVPTVRTMPEIVSAALARRRFQLLLLAIFGLTAFVTASVGIYGVVAHALARRTNEIGVRLALGARPSAIHRLVLREGLIPVAAGVAVGLGAALALAGTYAGLLFRVQAADPLTLLSVTVVLLAVSAAACYVPARRATRLAVTATLRD